MLFWSRSSMSEYDKIMMLLKSIGASQKTKQNTERRNDKNEDFVSWAKLQHVVNAWVFFNVLHFFEVLTLVWGYQAKVNTEENHITMQQAYE